MRIHIVAGVILNSEKTHVFITKRPSSKHKGGFWEFPGGKVETDELAEQALQRELEEELGIQVTLWELLSSFDYDYPEKSLSFDFYYVNQFEGEPYGREGQYGKWVAIEDLSNYEFPEANRPIVTKVMQDFNC